MIFICSFIAWLLDKLLTTLAGWLVHYHFPNVLPPSFSLWVCVVSLMPLALPPPRLVRLNPEVGCQGNDCPITGGAAIVIVDDPHSPGRPQDRRTDRM